MAQIKSRQVMMMKDFKCIGNLCTDNCCIGWDVDIDQKTFEAYQTITDSPLCERFQTDVKRHKGSSDPMIDYGRMVLKQDKRCPFLADNDLCDIQSTHGEEALSKVCNAYPRMVNQVDGIYELSATLSCPEVARLVLLHPQSLTIEEGMIDPTRLIITHHVQTDDPSLSEHPVKHFMALRDFAMDMIRSKHYTLAERLYLLGQVQMQMLPMYAGKQVDQIPKTISDARKKILNPMTPVTLKRIKANEAEQLAFLYAYTQVLDGDPQIENQTFGRLLKHALEGLLLNQGIVDQANTHVYATHTKRHVMPFMQAHERMFENYIVNSMFKNMYPFSEQGDPYAGYAMLMVRLIFIKSILTGLSAYGETLTTDLVVLLIQSFSKTLDHHKTFMDDVLYFMMENGQDDLQYLSQLFA